MLVTMADIWTRWIVGLAIVGFLGAMGYKVVSSYNNAIKTAEILTTKVSDLEKANKTMDEALQRLSKQKDTDTKAVADLGAKKEATTTEIQKKIDIRALANMDIKKQESTLTKTVAARVVVRPTAKIEPGKPVTALAPDAITVDKDTALQELIDMKIKAAVDKEISARIAKLNIMAVYDVYCGLDQSKAQQQCVDYAAYKAIEKAKESTK